MNNKLINGTELTKKIVLEVSKVVLKSFKESFENIKVESIKISKEIGKESVIKEHARLKEQSQELKEMGEAYKKNVEELNKLKDRRQRHDAKAFAKKQEKFQLATELDNIDPDDINYDEVLNELEEVEVSLAYQYKKLEELDKPIKDLEGKNHELGITYRKLMNRHQQECAKLLEKNGVVFKEEEANEQNVVLNNDNNIVDDYLVSEGKEIEDVPSIKNAIDVTLNEQLKLNDEIKEKPTRKMNFILYNPPTNARTKNITVEQAKQNLVLELLDISEKFELKTDGLEIRKDNICGEVVTCVYEQYLVISYFKEDDIIVIGANEIDSELGKPVPKEVGNGKGVTLNGIEWEADVNKDYFELLFFNLYKELVQSKAFQKADDEIELEIN